MSHNCPECGSLCYCDLEDTYVPEASDDCMHTCEPDYDDEPDEHPYMGVTSAADARQLFGEGTSIETEEKQP